MLPRMMMMSWRAGLSIFGEIWWRGRVNNVGGSETEDIFALTALTEIEGTGAFVVRCL